MDQGSATHVSFPRILFSSAWRSLARSRQASDPCVPEHQRDDLAQELLLFADRSLVDGMQLGHAIGRAKVFVAQDHDHVISKPDSLHET